MKLNCVMRGGLDLSMDRRHVCSAPAETQTLLCPPRAALSLGLHGHIKAPSSHVVGALPVLWHPPPDSLYFPLASAVCPVWCLLVTDCAAVFVPGFSLYLPAPPLILLWLCLAALAQPSVSELALLPCLVTLPRAPRSCLCFPEPLDRVLLLGAQVSVSCLSLPLCP